MNAVMLVAGLAMLLVGGEGLVRGAVVFATRMRLPMAVVGAVVLGFGTSMPEMLTSLSAALAGAPGIAIGNVLGSNIANIALILGVAAYIKETGDYGILEESVPFDNDESNSASSRSPSGSASGSSGSGSARLTSSQISSYSGRAGS